MRNRLGIYFHIPFCRQACSYCDFHFSTQLQLMEQMVEAQKAELLYYSNEYSKQPIQTIYFGGGTPSLMKGKFLGDLLHHTHQMYSVSSGCEVTLEINPDDVNKEKIQFWKSIGINRFSVGLQSFDDGVLRWMNRAHNGQQSQASIKMLQDAGFENISVDLIFGHGKLSRTDWINDVDQFMALQVPHVSAYALTVEPKTSLDFQLKKGFYCIPDDESTVEEFVHIHELFEKHGYEHYEVSNYAKVGYASKHNSAYWEGGRYLGIGPSAHSFNGMDRRFNVSNNPLYIKYVKLEQWNNIITWDRMDNRTIWNEIWLIGLRTKKGVDLSKVRPHVLYQESVEENINKWIASGHLIINGNQVSCTPLGWMVMDLILLDFFIIE